MSIRTEKVKHLIKEEISLIMLNHLKDPIFSMVTITDVSLSPDLKLAKIYFSVFDREKRELVLKKINSLNKTIRTLLAKNINIKSVPELNFYVDDTMDYVIKMDELFKKINENDNKRTEDI